jgi:hypothetical protein
MPRNRLPSNRPLLGLRSAVVLLFGILTGLGAGVLTYLEQHSLPGAVLTAGAGWAAGVLFFQTVIH